MAGSKRSIGRKEPQSDRLVMGGGRIAAHGYGRPNLVIGLAGPFGSGCTTMRAVLERQFHFHGFKVSDDIRAEVSAEGKAIRKGQPKWRRVLQEHGNQRRREDIGYWVKKVVDRIDGAKLGEERAILSLGDRSAEGGTLYVTTFPCFQCARLILDAGIKNIVYVEAYPVKETEVFLRSNGVEGIRPFCGFTARAFFRVFPKVN